MTPNALCYARRVVLAAVGLASCSGLAGQTENQLEQRYGRPNVFEIRPGVNAYPTFASDGNVCRMVVAKRPQVDNKLTEMNTTMSPALVKEIEDELIPEDQRGQELDNGEFRGGQGSIIQKVYENASIDVYRSSVDAYAIVITWRYHACSK